MLTGLAMTGPRLAFLAVLLGAPVVSAAESAAPAPASDTAAEVDEDGGPEPVPFAADSLGGHLLLSAGPLLSLPIAKLDNRTDFNDVAALGVGVGGNLGLGLGRNVSVGGYVEYIQYGHPSGCGSCEATALAFGPFVRYHLVQGVRFDPQLLLGVGYRKLDATSLTGKAKYTGIDWLKLELGGHWFAISQLGFGPYAELNLGTFTDRPPNRDAAVYGSFAFGLRVALDVQGK